MQHHATTMVGLAYHWVAGGAIRAHPEVTCGHLVYWGSAKAHFENAHNALML